MSVAATELDALIAKLETELAADPRVALLNSLKAARDAYAGGSGAANRPQEEMKARMPVEEGGPAMAPGRAQAFKLCREYLIGKAEPVRTRHLYEMVERAGVDLPGGMNNLSSMLGRHPRVFRSHGRQGWTLKEQPDNVIKNEEAADDLILRSASAASISGPPDQRTNLQ